MSHSIREQILQAVLARLVSIAGPLGAQVLRSPVLALPREQSPALMLFAESDAITERANDRVERQLTLRLVALAREISSGPAPESAESKADSLLVAAHAALMSDSNLGGLCLGIRELDSEWDLDDADAPAAALPARYQIRYRTLAADLSIQG